LLQKLKKVQLENNQFLQASI